MMGLKRGHHGHLGSAEQLVQALSAPYSPPTPPHCPPRTVSYIAHYLQCIEQVPQPGPPALQGDLGDMALSHALPRTVLPRTVLHSLGGRAPSNAHLEVVTVPLPGLRLGRHTLAILVQLPAAVAGSDLQGCLPAGHGGEGSYDRVG